jgi:acetolactate synthase-1/2/3 large subunit
MLGELAALMDRAPGPRLERGDWLGRLRDEERRKRAADAALLSSNHRPIHPARIYGELLSRIDRDAVVIGDGGDFVSFAGQYLDSHLPGCWLDPGPYGCLGTGLGYAIAARLAHPRRQVILLLGDGAFGFSAMDFDTLVRFKLPVVAICGNNGIWALEKHPMQAVYGFTMAADLQPGCRYDKVVEALGGFGQLVARPEEIGPALDRALASGQPSLINVLTDPEVAYPRSATLL